MNDLTPEEIKIIQNAKAQGRSFTSAMSEVSDFRFRGMSTPVATTEVLESQISKGVGTDPTFMDSLRDAGTSIKEGFQQGIETSRNADNLATGGLAGGLQITGGIGKALGDVAGGVLEKADDLTGEVVSSTAQKGIQSFLQTESGKSVADAFRYNKKAYDAWASENPTLASGVEGALSTAEGFGTVVGAGALGQLGKQGLKAGIEGAKDFAKKIFTETPDTTDAVEGEELFVNPFKATVADVPNDVMKEQVQDLVDRGIGESEAVSMLRLSKSPDDKLTATNMIKAVEDIDPNAPRPADIVGANIASKNKQLFDTISLYGKELDTVAKDLKGQKINVDDVKKQTTEMLNELGITTNKGVFNFNDSVFADIPELQKKIESVATKALKFDGDAFRAHTLKKSFDEMINYAKTSTGLTSNAERAIKSTRGILDDALDKAFPAYDNINTNLRDAFQVRDAITQAFGKNPTNAIIAGGKARTLLSNASVSRANTENALSALEDFFRAKGIETSGDIRSQAQFLSVLERLYGTDAAFSLRGQVEGAIKGVGIASDLLRDPIKGAGTLLAEGIDTITGRTTKQQIQKVKETLGGDSPESFKTGAAPQTVKRSLFHGTGEDILGDLKAVSDEGGVGILWSSIDDKIATKYIPTSSDSRLSILDTQIQGDQPLYSDGITKNTFKKIKDFGYDTKTVKGTGGKSFEQTLLTRDEITTDLIEKGYEYNDEVGAFIRPQVTREGNLYELVLKEGELLKIKDIRNSSGLYDELETVADMSNIPLFKKAQEEGYDGVRILDFVNDGLSNLEHESVGLFQKGVDKFKQIKIK